MTTPTPEPVPEPGPFTTEDAHTLGARIGVPLQHWQAVILTQLLNDPEALRSTARTPRYLPPGSTAGAPVHERAAPAPRDPGPPVPGTAGPRRVGMAPHRPRGLGRA